MSFRLLSRKCLNLSLYNLKSIRISTAHISGITSFQYVHNNFYLNVPQLTRFYTDQIKLEELIVDYTYVKNASTNKNTLVVDVREPDEIKEHGKIPNSVNIPLGSVSTALNTMSEKEFKQTYGTKKPSEDTEIIFYCMIGKRSGMAQQNAISLGFKNVKNYVGSWTDWASKNQ